MNEKLIDDIIEQKLFELQEEKYKLRIFETELLVRIEAEYGVEETLQDIRSISGVTVVTALDSIFRKDAKSYLSHIKIKFHPRIDSVTGKKFAKDHLLPSIRSDEIPGCKVVRTVKQPVQVS